MPCSRSARRPSVRRERSSAPSRPWRSSSWSARIALASCSSRPISVDLPSSTEPAVARRRRSDRATPPCPLPLPLEVPGNLAVLHRGFADAVVRARLAALRDLRRRDLRDHVVQRGRGRRDRAGAAHVADRPIADAGAEGLLPVDQLDVGRQRIEHAVAAEHLALVGEVDRRDLEALPGDVLPDVELGPVAEREHADVLAAPDAPVVDAPQLGALAAGVPLAEVVAEAEDPLLRARALLAGARAAERGVEAVLLDRVEQRRRLQAVARRARPGLLDHTAAVDRILHRGDDEPLAELGHAAVAVLDDLGEVVARVHVHERERERRGAERLLGQAQQDDRVLAAAEEQDRPRQLGRHLAHDVDRLGFEDVQMGQLVRAHAATGAFRNWSRCTSQHSPPTASGMPTISHAESSTPAFVMTPSAEPRSTQPSAGRRNAVGTRPTSAVPIHTPGIDPSRIVPMRAKSTLRPIQCASPGAVSISAAWKTSVPPTRRGVRRNSRINAGPISAPLPTDVRPSTSPSTRPIDTAPAFERAVSGTSARSFGARANSARASTASETTMRAPATSASTTVTSRFSRSSSATPAMEPGTLPNAIHFDTPRSTVPLRRWRQPPTVFVIAPYARSVPMATTGWTPTTRIRSGVMSEPPPMPVSPIRMPTPRPKKTTSGSIRRAARTPSCRSPPSGPRGRRRAACTARSRSTRSRGREAGGRAGRARGCAARGPSRSS